MEILCGVCYSYGAASLKKVCVVLTTAVTKKKKIYFKQCKK